MPHLLGSTFRSFVLNDNQLSTFDLTMAPPPPSLPAPCPGGLGTGCQRKSWVDLPPVNTDNAWRCSATGAGLLSSDYIIYRHMIDAAETLDIEKLKEAATSPSAMTVLRGGLALSGLLVSPSAAAAATGALNAAQLMARFRRTAALLRGTAPLARASAGDGTAPAGNASAACTQDAVADPSGDATWMPLVPLSPADEACACASDAASPGKLPAAVQVLIYVQPGQDHSFGGFFLQASSLEEELQQYTAFAGRMAPPPAWAAGGAILGAAGGAKAVNASFNVLQEAGVPVVAIWSQVRSRARHVLV